MKSAIAVICVLLSIGVFRVVVDAQNPPVPVSQNALGTIGYYLNSSSGTVINKIVTFTGNPSKAVTITAGSTSGAIGIVAGGAGTTGTATIQISGSSVPCVFDGATTAGHYVSISASVNGDCTDAGATAPSSQSLGFVLSTNAGGGTYKIDMGGSGAGASGLGGISRSCAVAADGSCVMTYNWGTSTPLVGLPIVNSGCGTCYVLSAYTSTGFTVTCSQACDLTFPGAYASAPPADFALSVGAASTSPVFQNSPRNTTFLLTATAINGYSATITPSLNAVTGITCTYSPATISVPGTSTATCPVTGSASANTTTGVTNTLVFHATDGTTAHDAAGTALLVWTGPVQQWPMNEGASPMLDTSGHSNNLTNANATYTNQAGLLSNTLTFAGASTSSIAANFTNTNFDGTSPFGMCGWVRFTANVQASSPSMIGIAWNGSTRGWFVDNTGFNPNYLEAYMISTAGSNYNQVLFNYSPLNGTAFHLCYTTDGTKSTAGMLMYVNGAGVSQHSVSASSLTGSIAAGAPFQVGSYSGNPTTGGIAGMELWGYALSSTQVAARYALGVY